MSSKIEETPLHTFEEEQEFEEADDLDDVDELASGSIQLIMQTKLNSTKSEKSATSQRKKMQIG